MRSLSVTGHLDKYENISWWYTITNMARTQYSIWHLLLPSQGNMPSVCEIFVLRCVGSCNINRCLIRLFLSGTTRACLLLFLYKETVYFWEVCFFFLGCFFQFSPLKPTFVFVHCCIAHLLAVFTLLCGFYCCSLTHFHNSHNPVFCLGTIFEHQSLFNFNFEM